MAEDTANHIAWWMKLRLQHKDYLGQIRHWDNLKMASDEEYIWIKDITTAQLDAHELRSIPFAELFYSKENLLFPRGSLLPECKQPSFLWTPIERALAVTVEGFNHNFFGVHQQQIIQLVPVDEEQQATALLAAIDIAGDYIVNAAAVRLQPLQWALIDNNKALLIGEPLLPLNGKAYWQKGPFIFPVGFAFEFPVLEKTVAQKIDATGNDLIWWIDEHNYCVIQKDALQPLSIASWRQTVQQAVANE
ncbi:hypothetical protein [Ferruginibacter sp. SUN106]|uniref:hypothetical protein n=1 Tax=Ferruginibacter sp. SUN106 TaxID=2978348 RepID=UPI003D369115